MADSMVESTTFEASPRLQDLPPETVSNIAGRLMADDLFALRSTCAKLEHKTFHVFAEEYFSSKCIHFTNDSLKTLTQISQHQRLRNYMKELWISTKQFCLDSQRCPCGWKLHHSGLPTKTVEARRTYALEQASLYKSGKLPDILSEALRSFSHLKTICWITNISQLEHNVDYRGRRKATRHCGYELGSLATDTPSWIHWQVDILVVLLKALAKSKTQLETFKNFDTDSRHGFCVGHLLSATELQKAFSKCARTITTLSLKLDVPLELNGYSRAKLTQMNTGALFPRLHDLTLGMHETDPQHIKSSVCAALLLKLDHKRLQRLKLDTAAISADALNHVIKRCCNLEVLKFEYTGLVYGTWIDIFETISDLPKLSHLHLMWLSEDSIKSFMLDTDGCSITGDSESEDSQDDSIDDPILMIHRAAKHRIRFREGCVIEQQPRLLQQGSSYASLPLAPWSFCLHSREEIQVMLPVIIEQYHTMDPDEHDAVFSLF